MEQNRGRLTSVKGLSNLLSDVGVENKDLDAVSEVARKVAPIIPGSKRALDVLDELDLDGKSHKYPSAQKSSKSPSYNSRESKRNIQDSNGDDFDKLYPAPKNRSIQRKR